MKVFVKGRGEVTLTQTNFVAQGGQASVYQRNGLAYKVYSDPKDAIPEAKFSELARIDDPNVVRPEDLLLDEKSAQPVGYTMRYLSDTYALCQLFPKAFRDRSGLMPDKVQKLVEKLLERVTSVHRAGALIVDLNELNVLASQGLDDLFMIDVDSYQTAGFKAEVIMPSVRDWSVKPAQFSTLSDWFSFGVLAFQLYIGVHPYRGTHASSAGVPVAERLEHRMRQHISAFDPAVSLPKICPPLNVIPSQMREWMLAVLQEGKRLPPPDPRTQSPVTVATRPVSVRLFGAGLDVAELYSFEHTVLDYAESGGKQVVVTAGGVFLNGRRVLAGPQAMALAGFSPKLDSPLSVGLNRGQVTVTWLQGGSFVLPFPANELARGVGGIYVRSRDKVFELEITETAGKPVVTGRVVANVLESASRLFEGCVVQSMLGSAFVSLFPRARAGYQKRITELDAYRVMDAKFQRGVLMVVGAKAGRYDRLTFRFDETFSNYDVHAVEGIAPAGLNFVVTANGICVFVTEDEKIEAFPAAMGPRPIRVVEDPSIGGDMKLLNIGAGVGFARDEKIYSMRLR